MPFGYRLAADGATLIPDDTEQHIIAVIREQRSLGLSLRAIVARLHERGYQSRAGKPLQLTQIMRIVNG
ncbi:MAG: hypothetical protein IPL99_24540 [Candidatus Competibacteraceae bacterium]|nr:hypothetical protein [Candidatus Competibacteraceae bacterium]